MFISLTTYETIVLINTNKTEFSHIFTEFIPHQNGSKGPKYYLLYWPRSAKHAMNKTVDAFIILTLKHNPIHIMKKKIERQQT